MAEIISNILGGVSPVMWVTCYFFAILGIITRLLYATVKGVKSKENKTPRKFSFKYWIRDNFLPGLASLFLSLIVIFIYLRFAQRLLGETMNEFIGFGIGLGLDVFIDKVKDLMPGIMKAKADNLKLE